MKTPRLSGCSGFLLGALLAAQIAGADAPKAATLEQVLAAKEDLWSLAAMRQPNGASYEFFAGLLPPLRYVNAQFRHYPIVLSAPGAPAKARLVSNGSALNAKAALNTWSDPGTPLLFFAGPDRAPFGERLQALAGPRYERGYLPIVEMDYQAGDATYRQTAFASVDWAGHAVVFARFALQDGTAGTMAARLAADGPLRLEGRTIRDEQGRVLLSFDPAWSWHAATRTLTAPLAPGRPAALALPTAPLPPSASPPPDAAAFEAQRKKCADHWERILAGAMRVSVPEPLVNDAWKSTLIGTLLLRHGNDMNYSAGNIYQTMYEAESGDAVRALLLWGLIADGREMIPPLLAYGNNPGLRFHDAAFKLQLLTHYYWLTRDAAYFRAQQPRWSRCAEILTRERDAATGLLPRESYCGDEGDKVFSLNVNANAWRGLRDLARVLRDLGETGDAGPVRATADRLREATLKAVAQSERLDTQPPFLPIALFGEEKPYDVLTATRRGSYWNLMIPYVIGSEIFRGTERETWMLRYLEQHGGLCMGMIRFHQHSGLFANEEGLDDLYTLRYVDALLRRDEPERAITSFYGKLAQGMTRDTFLSAEGTGLRPLDAFGRPMYLPPTCSGSAWYLWLLRSMLVQDYDLDHEGGPETLRLLFATPRRWLENGKTISVERAPTAFGEVSLRVESRLARGEVIAHLDPPPRNPPQQTLLRLRLPEGWHILSARAGSAKLQADSDGTVDVSTLHRKSTLRFQVRRN